MFEFDKYKKYLKHAKLAVAILIVILCVNIFGVIITHFTTIVTWAAIILVIGFVLHFTGVVKMKR